MKCAQVRGLFGAYWDDEITQAEREWIESHFAACAACREDYESYARALELIATLPREEASPDLLDRVMARTRRAATTPDRLPVGRAVWVPVTAAAALAVLAIATLSPWLRPAPPQPGAIARATAPAASREPIRVAPATNPAMNLATNRVAAPVKPSPASSGPVATVVDTLFDHAEDVEFILDPATVRRGHVRPIAPRAASVQGERAVITF